MCSDVTMKLAASPLESQTNGTMISLGQLQGAWESCVDVALVPSPLASYSLAPRPIQLTMIRRPRTSSTNQATHWRPGVKFSMRLPARPSGDHHWVVRPPGAHRGLRRVAMGDRGCISGPPERSPILMHERAASHPRTRSRGQVGVNDISCPKSSCLALCCWLLTLRC
jgi:hypothetical protein